MASGLPAAPPLVTVWATTPTPKMMRMAVPKNSASASRIRLPRVTHRLQVGALFRIGRVEGRHPRIVRPPQPAARIRVERRPPVLVLREAIALPGAPVHQ